MVKIIRFASIALATIGLVLTQSSLDPKYSLGALALAVLGYFVSSKLNGRKVTRSHDLAKRTENKTNTDTVVYTAAIGNSYSSNDNCNSGSAGTDAGGCDGGGA